MAATTTTTSPAKLLNGAKNALGELAVSAARSATRQPDTASGNAAARQLNAASRRLSALAVEVAGVERRAVEETARTVRARGFQR